MPKLPSTFCIMPFIHANVRTNGDIHMCCYSTEIPQHNIKSSSIVHWWASIEQARIDMLEGTPLTACAGCYNQEAHGLTSQRQSNNKRFKVVSDKYAKEIVNRYYKDLVSPIDYDLQITNICNLKCIMCRESESSALLTENRILKISNVDQTDYNWKQEEIDKLLELLQNPNTKSVTIRGGEPFLIPQIKKAMLDVIRTNRASLIDLQIVTNCTEFDIEWVNILEKFKSIWMICSIDAVGDRYEFIRYGATWNKVDKNIDLIKTIKNVNITINTVIQNINLLGIPDLLAWAEQKDLYINLSRIQDPAWLTIDTLPVAIKQMAIEELNKLSYSRAENLSGIIKYLKESTQTDQQLWDEFSRLITLKDNHRKTDFKNTFPEFYKYFNYAKTK